MTGTPAVALDDMNKVLREQNPANPPAPAAGRRPFAEDVRLGAAGERVSHYSVPGGR